jgi:hypothetical protein
MRRYMLALAAFVTLTAGTAVTANALDIGVGPNGVYVGPNRHHGYYDQAYGNCRTIIDHRTNRFGEDVTVRRRICD